MEKTRANIAVVTYNRLELTRRCLEALFATTQGEYRANIVDNGSSDGSREYLLELACRPALSGRINVILLDKNYGVAVAANQAWAAQNAAYYVKLDNDVCVNDGQWLNKLTALLEKNRQIGMAGYRLVNWPHRRAEIALADGEAFIESDTCNGGCAVIRRDIFEELGFWNEDYGKYGFEDQEYSQRLRQAGYYVGYPSLNSPEMTHLGYEAEYTSQDHESGKRKSLEKINRGERLFVLNRFLFAQGIRPLRVERKYRPLPLADGTISFKTNPAYAPISKLQSEFAARIDYQGLKDGISLDLSRLKDNAPQ